MSKSAGPRLQLTAVLVLVIFAPSLADSQAPSGELGVLEAYLDPANTVLQPGEDHADAELRLVNHGTTPLSIRLETGVLLLKNGSAAGRTVFPSNSNKDVVGGIRLEATPVGGAGDGSDRTDVPVSFVGLSYVGVYGGNIDIVNENSAGQRIRLTLEVRRLAAGFVPAFRGSLVSNGVLTARPQSSRDSIFSFIVENPESGRDSDLAVVIPIPPSGKDGKLDIAARPERFHLAPGGTEQVELTLAEVPDHGQFNGTLFVRDTNSLGVQKDLSLVFQPSYMSWSTSLWLIGLVAVGTGFSILVGTIVPTMVVRQKGWQRLADLQKTIDASVRKGTPAHVALWTRQNQIDFLAHQIWWVSPKASDDLAEIAKHNDALETHVNLIAEVTRLREHIRSSDRVPVSVAPNIDDLLDDIELEVIAGKTKNAEAKRDAVVARINDAGLLPNVQKSLAANIDSLPDATPANIPDAGMRYRVQSLKDERAKLDGVVDASEILSLDRECYAAHLYLVRFVGEILKRRPGDTRYQAMEAPLLLELADGVPGLWRAADLIKSMELGVLPCDIRDALASKACTVLVEPLQPSAHELAEFRVEFKNMKLNNSPLVDNLDFVWNFGDNTMPARGRRSVHYFKQDRPSGYEVKVRIPNGLDVPTEILALPRVTVRRARSKSGRIFGVELLYTGVGLGGAIGLAYISHLADVRPFDSLQDYFNPVLWGFGLDQMKGLATKLRSTS